MNKPYRPRRQSGVVLIIGLVFLMLMTVIGVAAIQSSTTQERMAANAGDRAGAFQAAEDALLEGENAVIDNDCGSLTSLLDELPDADQINGSSWDNDVAVDCSSDSQSVNIIDCAYIVTRIPERLEDDESEAAEETETCGGFYYVSAKAESDKGMTVVLRSTVFKRY